MQRALACRWILLEDNAFADAWAIRVNDRRSRINFCCRSGNRRHSRSIGGLGTALCRLLFRFCSNDRCRFNDFFAFLGTALGRRFGLCLGLLGQQCGLPLFLIATFGQLAFVQDRLRRFYRCLRLHDLGLFDFYKRAFLANLNLNRSRLTSRVGLLDLSCLFAGKRDLFLFFLVAVRCLQVRQQMRFVLFREIIGRRLQRDASRFQLFQQKLLRELKLLGKLCNGG